MRRTRVAKFIPRVAAAAAAPLQWPGLGVHTTCLMHGVMSSEADDGWRVERTQGG